MHWMHSIILWAMQQNYHKVSMHMDVQSCPHSHDQVFHVHMGQDYEGHEHMNHSDMSKAGSPTHIVLTTRQS